MDFPKSALHTDLKSTQLPQLSRCFIKIFKNFYTPELKIESSLAIII